MAQAIAKLESIPLTRSQKRARFTIGDIVKGRDLRIDDVVSIVDTDFPLKVVLRSFFEIIVVPTQLNSLETPTHIHRLKILPFTRVILLERE